MNVSGKTAICFTLAHPASHVRTPAAFNAVCQQRGTDAAMVALDVPACGLAPFFAVLRGLANVTGAVITVPHKTAATSLCDDLSPRAQAIGAVNVVRRRSDGSLHGDMLDGVGFVGGLRGADHAIEGRNVLLAGAGGAARAIAFALAEAGVARLAVCNRTQSHALDVVERVRRAFPNVAACVATADPDSFDIIVNATSLGLKNGDPPPIDVSRLRAGQLVAEIIMQPERTALIVAAEAAGARIHLGKAMLEAQLDLIVELLAPPPAEAAP
jgi:shikimate dehydrogenase